VVSEVRWQIQVVFKGLSIDSRDYLLLLSIKLYTRSVLLLHLESPLDFVKLFLEDAQKTKKDFII